MSNTPAVTVTYQGNLRTESTHLQSGDTLLTDAPVDNQGKGEAFSPTDLVSSALASCMLTIMGIKAESMEVDITGSRAEVIKIMSANPPRRIAEIIITITLPAHLDARSRKILEATAHTCPVAHSLHPDTIQTCRFEYV